MAIVAGTISEKLNLTGGFFEWRRPFDFSTRERAAVASARGPPTKPRSAGLSEALEPQSKVHLERRFRSLE